MSRFRRRQRLRMSSAASSASAELRRADTGAGGMGGARSPALVEASRLPAVNLRLASAAPRWRSATCSTRLSWTIRRSGDVSELTDRHVRAVLATPIVAFDRVIGVLGLHRAEPGGLDAIRDLARRGCGAGSSDRDRHEQAAPRERPRLDERQALLKAGEALTSDLRVDVVIDRLVDEMRSLVNGDAAYCWTFAPDGEELVCRAVVGLARVGGRPPDPGRRHGRRGDRARARRFFAQLLRDRAAASDGELRELRSGDGRADPLVRRDSGVLGVCSREPDRFDESDRTADRGSREPRRRWRFATPRRTGRARVRRRVDAGSTGSPRCWASRCPQRRRSTRSPRLRRRRSAASPPPCPLQRRRHCSLPAPAVSTRGLATYLRAEAGRSDRARSRRQGARTRAGSSTTAASRPGWRKAAGDTECDSPLAIPLVQPAGAGLALVIVFFRGETVFRRREQLGLGGPCRRCSPRRARAVVSCTSASVVPARSRSGSRVRASRLAGELGPDNSRRRREPPPSAAGGRRGVDSAARGRRGGRARSLGWRRGGGRCARRRLPGWSATSCETRSTRAIADVRDDARIGDAGHDACAGYATAA